MQDHDVIISKTETGFIAAATSSPFFCFQAETEDAVMAKVRAALAFYHSAADKVAATVPPKRSLTLTRVLPTKRISSRELAAA